jgi:hypothetical protein
MRQKAMILMMLLSLLTIGYGQDTPKAIWVSGRNTPAGKSATALMFGIATSYAVIAPYGRYTLTDAPADIADIRLEMARGGIKRLQPEIEVYIRNNRADAIITRVDFRFDVFDSARRTHVDKLFASSTDKFKPGGSKQRGYVYISDLRLPGDAFVLIQVTKLDFSNGETWKNPAVDSTIAQATKAIEEGEMK